MIAYRQFLTLSTSSVIILGSGGLAIAEETPAPQIAFAPHAAAEPSMAAIARVDSAEEPQGATVTIATANPPQPVITLTFQDSQGVLRQAAQKKQTLTVLTTVAAMPQNSATTGDVHGEIQGAIATLPNQGSLIAANLTPKQTLSVPTQIFSQAPHYGSLAGAIAQIPTPTSEPTPTAMDEGSPVETSPETTTETTATDIPTIDSIPSEYLTNLNLQALLEPVEDARLMPPTTREAVAATEIVNLTLEDAIQLALERNQDLQEATLNYERAKYQLREAIADEYPSLTSQIDLTSTESASGELQAQAAGTGETSPIDSFNSRLELSYDIYTGGRRSGQIDAASTQLKINELDIVRLTKETRLNAASTYYDLQSADFQVGIEESAVLNAQKSLEDAELLEGAGLGTKFDILRAQVELANAEQRLTRAYANQSTARRRLAQILSLDATVDPRPADDIRVAGKWELSLEDSILLAIQQREELQQQLLVRELDGYQQQIALANIRPQVSIFANYDVLDVFEDDLDVADGFTVGARMRWNLFDGGAAAARADQEQVDKAIAENRFLNQRNQIRLAVETAYYDLKANERNIQTASTAVQLADESLRLARLRFTAGVGTQTDVIAAQTELTAARNNLLQAIADYNSAYAQLKREVSIGEELEQLSN